MRPGPAPVSQNQEDRTVFLSAPNFDRLMLTLRNFMCKQSEKLEQDYVLLNAG